MRRVLADSQIPVCTVEDNLLKTVTDWHLYRMDIQNLTIASTRRLWITQDWERFRVFMDLVPLDWTKTDEHFSFPRLCSGACNDRILKKGKALFQVSSFLAGPAATKFNRILPDTPGHIPGRTFACFLRRCAGSCRFSRTVSP